MMLMKNSNNDDVERKKKKIERDNCIYSRQQPPGLESSTSASWNSCQVSVKDAGASAL